LNIIPSHILKIDMNMPPAAALEIAETGGIMVHPPVFMA
jgi:hypothetical protein